MTKTTNILSGITLLLLVFCPLCRGQKSAKAFPYDYSNRCSLVDKTLLGGFNGQTDGFEADKQIKISINDAKSFNLAPHEGSHSLLVSAPDMPANNWRSIYKSYSQALDLSKTPMIEFGIFSPAGPGRDIFVRLVLSDGKEKFEVQAPIISDLWRVVIFDIHQCPFLCNIKKLEIGIMNSSNALWKNDRFLIDGIEAGKPLDLFFHLKGSSERFTAKNGSIKEATDKMVFQFKKESAICTTALRNSRNSIYNPQLEDRNTFFVVMANKSNAQKLRLSFITKEDSNFDSKKSKIFSIRPNSNKTGYFFNLSDNRYAHGTLTGFKLEPIGAPGSWEISRISFEQEAPIEEFAGAITSCKADNTKIYIEGTIKPKFAKAYQRLSIYEAPMFLNDGTLHANNRIYEGPINSSFRISDIANSRLNGKMTRLSTRFLAVIENDSTHYQKVAPYFYVENWNDFDKNPYSFSLPDKKFNVLKFGAKGDGFTDDTRSFQTAIDEAAKQGGGQVVVPGSNSQYGRRYVITHLMMRSNIDLHLEKGSILWQSGDYKDYTYKPYYGHDMVIPYIPWTHCLYVNLPLIQAKSIDHFKITGPGNIRMYDTYSNNPDWTHYAKTCSDRIHIVPLGFWNCHHIELSNFDILRSNNYHTLFHFCSYMFLANLKLHEVKCVSGDGLSFGQDINHILIDRVFFESNDDGIVLTTSYKDPRGSVSTWRPANNDRDHSIRGLKVIHSYINSGGGKAIALIPWGSTNPDQQKQEIDSIEVYDCVLKGGYSVGTWPDNPFDGKPFTNTATDDYSPVKNFRIFNNEYLSPCDLLCIKPTNFLTDCGIKSSSTFQNGDFAQGHIYWTMSGNAGVKDGYGYAAGGGELFEGLYLTKGNYTFTAKVKDCGEIGVRNSIDKRIIGGKEFKETEWSGTSIEVSIPEDGNYDVGIRSQEKGYISNCRIEKTKH